MLPWCIIVSYLFTAIQSWSGEGHRVVARVAFEFLKNSAQQYLADHLSGGVRSDVERVFINISGYMDKLDWSSELHFSHTPKRTCSEFLIERDCGIEGSRRCIVTALRDYILKASDVSLSVAERSEAISIIVHLLADIHHPLHIGFADDMGGTLIELSDPRGKSLHQVWDYDLVNRKQRDVGVFEDQDQGAEVRGEEVLEDDDEVELSKVAQPWKLSEHLISEFSDKRSLYPYMLNVKVSDVSSLEAAFNIAARMASQTAMQYTCEFAYRNTRNEWIESGEALSEEYLSSRAEIAMELVKFSGIRLAEILNMIAVLFNRNKRGVETGWEIKSGQFIIPDENRFMALRFDFNPDNLLHEEFVGCSEGFENQHPSDEHVVTHEDGTGEEALQSQTASTLDQAIKPNISKSARRNMKKKLAKKLFDGVDLEQVVLIMRRSHYIVTGAHLVESTAYFPHQYDTYKVRFEGNQPDMKELIFLFDVAFFGKRVYSDQLIARSLMKIRQLPLNDETIESWFLPHEHHEEDEEGTYSSLSFRRVFKELAPIAGELKLGPERIVVSTHGEEFARHAADFMEQSRENNKLKVKSKKRAQKDRTKENKKWRDIFGYLPTQEEIWEYQLRQNIFKICFIQVGRILLFIHTDSLENSSTPMIRANQFNISPSKDPYSRVSLVIDNVIFDGQLTREMDLMLEQARRENTQLCKSKLKKRPSLSEELQDINRLLHTSDPERAKDLKRIRYLNVYPGDEGLTFFRFHWSIHAEVPDMPAQTRDDNT